MSGRRERGGREVINSGIRLSSSLSLPQPSETVKKGQSEQVSCSGAGSEKSCSAEALLDWDPLLATSPVEAVSPLCGSEVSAHRWSRSQCSGEGARDGEEGRGRRGRQGEVGTRSGRSRESSRGKEKGGMRG